MAAATPDEATPANGSKTRAPAFVVARIRLNKAHRKLAGMRCLLDVITFHIGDVPDILRIFAQGIPGRLAGLFAFVMFLAGILRRNPNLVEVENVVIRFRVPHDGFVAPGEASLVMQAVAEMPDDSVPQLQLMLLENRGKFNVERCNLSVVDKITYLPTKAARVFQARNKLINHSRLPRKVFFKGLFGFVCLPNIVGRGCHDQIEDGLHGQCCEKLLDVTIPNCKIWKLWGQFI